MKTEDDNFGQALAEMFTAILPPPTFDISYEEQRKYIYTDGEFAVDGPVSVQMLDSGHHLVVDDLGVHYYIVPGWRAIVWYNKEEDQPETETAPEPQSEEGKPNPDSPWHD